MVGSRFNALCSCNFVPSKYFQTAASCKFLYGFEVPEHLVFRQAESIQADFFHFSHQFDWIDVAALRSEAGGQVEVKLHQARSSSE